MIFLNFQILDELDAITKGCPHMWPAIYLKESGEEVNLFI